MHLTILAASARNQSGAMQEWRYMRLKWDLGGWLDEAELLLLLELLVGGLDGNGEADLGLLLLQRFISTYFRDKWRCRLLEQLEMAYLEVIHISSEGDLDWWRNALLPQAAELSGGVDLCTESRHAEIVLTPTLEKPSLDGPPIIGLPPASARLRSTPASSFSESLLQ